MCQHERVRDLTASDVARVGPGVGVLRCVLPVLGLGLVILAEITLRSGVWSGAHPWTPSAFAVGLIGALRLLWLVAAAWPRFALAAWVMLCPLYALAPSPLPQVWWVATAAAAITLAGSVLPGLRAPRGPAVRLPPAVADDLRPGPRRWPVVAASGAALIAVALALHQLTPRADAAEVGAGGVGLALVIGALNAAVSSARLGALADRGAPSHRVLVRALGEGAYAAVPIGHPSGRGFLLQGLTPVGVPASPEHPDEDEGERDLTANELGAWADAVLRTGSPTREGDDEAGPEVAGETRATLIGRLIGGGPVVLLLDDGRAYRDDLRPARAARLAVPAEATDAAAEPLASASRARHRRRGVGVLGRRLITPVVVAAAARGIAYGLVARFGVEQTIWVVLGGVLLAHAVAIVSGPPGPVAQRHSRGVLLPGAYVDRVLGTADVRLIAAGDRGVGIDLHDGEVCVIDPNLVVVDIPPRAAVGAAWESGEDADRAGAVVVADTLQDWLAHPDAAGRGGRRPALGLAVAALIVGAVVAGALLGVVG